MIFSLFSIFDLVCIFNEIKSVVFNTLNFERVGMVLAKIYDDVGADTNEITSANDVKAMRPDEVAKKETVFLPTMQGEDLFTTWSALKCRSDILKGCFSLLKDEKFIITLEAQELRSLKDMVLPNSLAQYTSPSTYDVCLLDRCTSGVS